MSVLAPLSWSVWRLCKRHSVDYFEILQCNMTKQWFIKSYLLCSNIFKRGTLYTPLKQTPWDHFDATVSICSHSLHALLSHHPPLHPLSPFLSEDWTAFCSQSPETQAVSAGNIFHSPGPTGALAATRYGSFQSLVLLGKYGSLWTGPLCRLGGVGRDECRWWRQLNDTVWHTMTVCVSDCNCHEGIWQGLSISIHTQRSDICFFPQINISAWVSNSDSQKNYRW